MLGNANFGPERKCKLTNTELEFIPMEVEARDIDKVAVGGDNREDVTAN